MPQTILTTTIFGGALAPVASSACAAALLAQSAAGGEIEKWVSVGAVAATSAAVAAWLGRLVISRSIAQSDADRNTLLEEYKANSKAKDENTLRWEAALAKQVEVLARVEATMRDVAETMRHCGRQQ